MKSVLMIVYSLPPHKYPGTERVVNLINSLRDYGWEPIILTRRAELTPLEEHNLQIPENIDIVRTGYQVTAGFPRIIHAVSKFLTSLLLPDGQRLWEFLSRQKAVRIAKNGGIDLVYTVSPPYSSHLIGLRLKKKYPKLPWVADLNFESTTARSYEKNLLARITENADLIIRGESEIPTQELSESFEKACRAVVAKKMENS
jgi:hypothetical protein